MLLRSYRKEIILPKCTPDATTLHCIAHLDQDIGAVLPYLNAELGGDFFVADPPAMTFRARGKLVTLQAREIAIRALNDALEGERLLCWLKDQINDVWQRRAEIVPMSEPRRRPTVLELLRLLPRTNCGACGQPTCQVFATQVLQGLGSADDCPPLRDPERRRFEALCQRCRDVS